MFQVLFELDHPLDPKAPENAENTRSSLIFGMSSICISIVVWFRVQFGKRAHRFGFFKNDPNCKR